MNNNYNFKDSFEEKIYNNILQPIFHKYFVFPNPQLENNKELCDFIILLNDVAIIIQIKTKIHDIIDKRYIQKAIYNPTKQLRASINRNKENKIHVNIKNKFNENIKLTNSNFKKIKKIYGVVINNGNYELANKGLLSITQKESSNIKIMPHIFNYTEINEIINYIHTPVDFIDYLDKRELIINKNNLLDSERNILGIYLQNKDGIAELTKKWVDASLILFDEFNYKEFLKNQLDIKKNNEKYSVFIDDLIFQLEKCESQDDYLFIEQILKLNSFQKCNFGIEIFKKYIEFKKSNKNYVQRFLGWDNFDFGIYCAFSNGKKDDILIKNKFTCWTLYYKTKQKLSFIIGVLKTDIKDMTKYNFVTFGKNTFMPPEVYKDMDKRLVIKNTKKKHCYEYESLE